MNRDALLQRYSLLLGRLNSLSSSLAAIPAGSSSTLLSRFSLHPLNPLPQDADVMAHETLFQAMNTMPLPDAVQEDPERLRTLKEMDEGALEALLQALKGRLQEGQSRCKRLEEVVREKEDEVELNMRIGDESLPEAEERDSLQAHLRLMQSQAQG